MRLDLYQAETQRLACEQASMLEVARDKLLSNEPLTALERSGALHALQILIENAIGKAKDLMKSAGEPVPVSAYDAFASSCAEGHNQCRAGSAVEQRHRYVQPICP
jgi:uncharacterized protein YutE (UPF0331/DUF86 family)